MATSFPSPSLKKRRQGGQMIWPPSSEIGRFPLQELEKPIGKLGFHKTNLFGGFARTRLRPLYRKFYARNFNPQISENELRTFQWWVTVIRPLQPRIPRPCNRRPDFAAYAGAALLSRTIASLAISHMECRNVAELLAEASTPHAWFRRFHRTNPIIGMEMLEPLAFLWTAQNSIRHKRINLYIDNDAASKTLIRGGCADPFLASMIKSCWELAEKLQLDISIGRVGSTVNPADLPTRRKNLPFEIKHRVHLRNLSELLMRTRQWYNRSNRIVYF